MLHPDDCAECYSRTQKAHRLTLCHSCERRYLPRQPQNPLARLIGYTHAKRETRREARSRPRYVTRPVRFAA